MQTADCISLSCIRLEADNNEMAVFGFAGDHFLLTYDLAGAALSSLR